MSLRHKKLEVPARCSESPKVKLGKGDTLEKIAKKHGLKSGKDIWNFGPNKKLVKLRKKAENLQPGDVLYIPQSEAEKKELLKAVDEYNKTKRAIVAYAELQEKKIAEIRKHIDALYEEVKNVSVRKFDGAEGRKLMDTVVAATLMIEKALDGLPAVKTPAGTVSIKFDGVKKVSAALKKHRATMKGGTMDDAKLNLLRLLIDGAKAEIRTLEKKIEEMDKELDEAAVKTLGVFCKRATMRGILTEMFKNMKWPVPN